MVKVKLNSFSEKSYDFPHYEDERLSEIFLRLMKKQNISRDHYKYFKIFIDGVEVEDQKMWSYIKPKPSANVLIVLVPQSGDVGRAIGQIAVAALAIYTGGALGAVIAIGGNLLLNQLFPPPAIDIGGASVNRQQEQSQMYSIGGQSNSTKKYGIVPRVYGDHRIFPNVAANPYTLYEVDEESGELVQYFYAVYDLGYGPLVVSDIKIGDTPFEFFDSAYYRLVDFNKPDIDEGAWDNELNKDLSYYKGDVNSASVSAAINENEVDPGSDPAQYQVTRTADENPDNVPQEIIVDFAFPQGLTTLATNGNRSQRTVELNVQFAEVGTEDWKGFNDELFSNSFTAIGDSVTGDTRKIEVGQPVRNIEDRYFSRYSLLSAKAEWNNKANAYGIPYAFLQGNSLFYVDRYGFKKGDTEFYAITLINNDSFIRYGNDVVGKIQSRVDVGGGVFKYTLYQGFPYDIFLFQDYTRIYKSGFTDQHESYYIDYLNQDIPISTDQIIIEDNTAGVFRIKGNKQKPVYASLRFTPKTTNQVKIRVTRIRSYGGATFRIFDEMSWQSVTTRLDTAPIVTNQRHVFLELKVKATDQLNGTIRNLSAVCQSVLDVYDQNTDTWSKEVTSNPAWIFADILTGSINKRAINKNRLDTDSLIEWAEFCDEVPTPPPGQEFVLPRFTGNFVVDTAQTVAQLINQLTSSCQASINIVNGRYGVLVDKLKTVPVQLFTPRNSYNFTSSRTYGVVPDALKVKYVDPAKSWGVYEEIVYAEGKDATTAENFEEIDTFGCTNQEQAWRLGRYFQVSAALRQENISIEVDFEHLICTRGDFVKLQHDVMKVGGRPARVKSVSGSDIVIDDNFITEIGVNYGYTFRGINGIETSTMTINDTESATVDGPVPQVGDLIVWGEVDKITIDCLVKTITPNDSETATLTLMEKADAVYEAESTTTIPDYDPQLVKSLDADTDPPAAVENLEVEESSYRCGDGNYIYYVSLIWDAPTAGAVIEQYEIYADFGEGNQLVGFSSTPVFEYIVDSENLGVEHLFKVVGVASNGSKINLGEATSVSDTPLGKTAPPSNVPFFNSNILNETIQLDWELVEDCDIENYLIRFSPNVNGTWESSVELQRVDRNTSLVQFQARVGIYLIKAIDWAGNQSETAARVITSIPELTNVNIIEETNDFPTLVGNFDQVQDFGGGQLILKEKTSATPGVVEYFEEGYYYYENLLDLGEIYTVRLQSLIEAEGFSVDDLMSSWTTLSAVSSLSTSSVSDWDVETQYRATDQYNVMGEWTTLASIDPISEGAQENFTDWRKFTIGDFTARIFQFRLKLKSNNPNVTPRVFDGVIKSDMPDRVESDNDLVATGGSLAVTYSTPFKGPGTSPTIQITQDNAQQGDYYQLENKTLSGFTIKFYDKNATLVTRQFDYLVKGYGRKQNAVI